jgi:hypothetical protein
LGKPGVTSPENENLPIAFNILRDVSVAIPKFVDEIPNRRPDGSDEEIPTFQEEDAIERNDGNNGKLKETTPSSTASAPLPTKFIHDEANDDLPSPNVSRSTSPEHENLPIAFNILRDVSVAIPKFVDETPNRRPDSSDEEIPEWKTSFRENFNIEDKSTTENEDEIDEEEIKKLKSKMRLSNRVRRPVNDLFVDKQVIKSFLKKKILTWIDHIG